MTNEMVNDIVDWIKKFFHENAWAKGAIVGMSGGKDSLIVAKLCTLALGKDRVFGLIMPNGQMVDRDDAERACKCVGINFASVDIASSVSSTLENVFNGVKAFGGEISTLTTLNIPPRIRMTTLYAHAASLGLMVANTSNLSEACIGYTTKWGDNVGDFAPIIGFTKSEVVEIGLLLGLPKKLVEKAPSDGLTGKTDEESLQITYDELDSFIRTGEEKETHKRFVELYNNSKHKREQISQFDPNLPNFFDKRANLKNLLEKVRANNSK